MHAAGAGFGVSDQNTSERLVLRVRGPRARNVQVFYKDA